MSITDILQGARLSRLHEQLQKKGRLPKVDIVCEPLGGGKSTFVNSFLQYHFSSNILVPVDSFSFTFSAPNDLKPVTSSFNEGDLISIFANDVQISTGIIDSVEIEVDAENGERVTLQGRDLMGQLADQHCVTIDCKPIWGNSLNIESVCEELIATTRIPGIITQDAPSKAFLFATEPNESRLNALLRFLDPLNCLSWMAPDGSLTVGRPNFSGEESGVLMCNKTKRKSNVLQMSASRSATQVPSVIAGLYSDAQKDLVGLPAEQVFTNSNSRVQELKKRGHQIFRAMTSSVPSGATPEDFRTVAELQVAGTPKTMLEYMAAREFARANANVLQVKAVVPGHFNDNGEPYMPDTLYAIDFDRGGVNEVMYCYGVEWALSPTQGQTSVLSFCPVNTLVAGAKAL